MSAGQRRPIPASFAPAQHQSVSTATSCSYLPFLKGPLSCSRRRGGGDHCRALKQPFHRPLDFFSADLHLGKELIFFFSLSPPAAGRLADIAGCWVSRCESVGLGPSTGGRLSPRLLHIVSLRVRLSVRTSVRLSLFATCGKRPRLSLSLFTTFSQPRHPPPTLNPPHPHLHQTARPCPTPRLSLLPLCRLCA